MSNCRSNFVSAAYFYILKLVVVPEWQDLHRKWVNDQFSSYTLLTEDLIAIKYARYLFLHIFTLSVYFSDIKHSMLHALLTLILRFKIKNQYNRPYK